MSAAVQQISITQTFPRIEVESSRSGVVVEQNDAKLEAFQPIDRIQMEHDQTFQVVIDQSQCFIESGIKPVSYVTKEFVQKAMQNSSQYINRSTSEGHALANNISSKSGANIIANLAKNVYPAEIPPSNIKLMPQSRPNISSVGGKLSMNFSPRPVEINVTKPSVNVNVTPANINVYLAQKGTVQITVGNS